MGFSFPLPPHSESPNSFPMEVDVFSLNTKKFCGQTKKSIFVCDKKVGMLGLKKVGMPDVCFIKKGRQKNLPRMSGIVGKRNLTPLYG